jgi:hypothetical protein
MNWIQHANKLSLSNRDMSILTVISHYFREHDMGRFISELNGHALEIANTILGTPNKNEHITAVAKYMSDRTS